MLVEETVHLFFFFAFFCDPHATVREKLGKNQLQNSEQKSQEKSAEKRKAKE